MTWELWPLRLIWHHDLRGTHSQSSAMIFIFTQYSFVFSFRHCGGSKNDRFFAKIKHDISCRSNSARIRKSEDPELWSCLWDSLIYTGSLKNNYVFLQLRRSCWVRATWKIMFFLFQRKCNFLSHCSDFLTRPSNIFLRSIVRLRFRKVFLDIIFKQ